MFEVGAELKKRVGATNVFDYTLGNPSFEPPSRLIINLHNLLLNPAEGMHGYMNNAGFPHVRNSIADFLNKKHALEVQLSSENIVMTCGAAGGLNVVFESILNTGEEVVVPSPYFVEYAFYVDRHQGKLVPVPSKTDFQLDLDIMSAAIGEKTKAVLLNSPHNPTGVIYFEESLRKLAGIIREKEQELGRDILLITDEPYSGLVFDGAELPSTLSIFPHSILATSNSKDLGLAGERIGYLAINPLNTDPAEIFNAIVFNNRILGFVNAPALMQRLVAEAQGEVVGMGEYLGRRDILYKGLSDLGYDVIKPQGTFYMFPKSPDTDDVEFTRKALEYNLLIVPGTGFGAPGYFRLSFSSISQEQIQKSMEAFRSLAVQYGIIK